MRLVATILPAIAVLCLALPATAQDAAPPTPACAPYRTVADNLLNAYHEVPVARALGAEGKVLMVVFASDGGATWTAVSVRAHDRLTCIVAAGTNWTPNAVGVPL